MWGIWVAQQTAAGELNSRQRTRWFTSRADAAATVANASGGASVLLACGCARVLMRPGCDPMVFAIRGFKACARSERPVWLAIRRCFFFFQAEDGIRDDLVTGVQTCALPI